MDIRSHVFATLLHTAMQETYGFETNELKSQCWWESKFVNHILMEAKRLGYVRRPSRTQVEWTDKGVAFVHTNVAGLREQFENTMRASGVTPWWCCKAEYPNHEPTCENYGMTMEF